MIAILDYGVGNLFSLSGSLKALGLETEITEILPDCRRQIGLFSREWVHSEMPGQN